MRRHIRQQHPRVAFGVLVLLLLCVGGLLRCDGLGRRPMHTDEAVHAVKLGEFLETGVYRYDPHDYHGPTLYYLTLPVLWWHGVDSLRDMEAPMLRVVPAVAGVLLAALVLALAGGIGARAAVYAALFTAVSPAFVFYSRYYIQEQLLVLFTLAAIVAGWRYARTRAWGWAVAAGVCLGLTHATKETAVLAWGAMAGAMVLAMAWSHRRGETPLRLRGAAPGHVLGAAAVVGLLVSAVLVSGLLRHPSAVLDSWWTYVAYVARSGGAGLHDHPWHYYLAMLLFTRNAPGPWWSEGLIVGLALVGTAVALGERMPPGVQGRDAHPWHLRRALAFYTLLLTGVYAVIPYKTPWCVLGFLSAMTIMAGIGADWSVQRLPRRGMRVAAILLLAAGMVHLGHQARRATSARYDADPRNPYVYGHTSRDAERLARRVEALAACHADGEGTVVKVMGEEYWPLPWYLRHLERVGYWTAMPESPEAPLVIASAEQAADLAPRLAGRYHEEYYGLRPGVLVVLFVDKALWAAYMDAQVTR